MKHSTDLIFFFRIASNFNILKTLTLWGAIFILKTLTLWGAIFILKMYF